MYSTKDGRFINLKEYYSTKTEPMMRMGRMKHSATLMKEKIIITGGIAATVSLAGTETIQPNAGEDANVSAELTSSESVIGRSTSTLIIFVMRHKTSSINKWTNKAEVTLTISGPARFQDIDADGKQKRDAGLTQNIQTVNFSLYPGSQPYKYSTRIISSIKNQDLGDIKISAVATFMDKTYKREVTIKRDYKISPRVKTDGEIAAERAKNSFVISLSADKTKMGRGEAANISVTAYDNRPKSERPSPTTKAQCTLTVKGPAIFWRTDADLTQSNQKVEFALLPQMGMHRVPNGDIPKLRILSSYRNRDLGPITVELAVGYGGTTYWKSIVIQRDYKSSAAPLSEEESAQLKKSIEYKINVSQTNIAQGEDARLTIRMNDSRDFGKLPNIAAAAQIKIQAQGDISIRYSKPKEFHGLWIHGSEEIISKNVTILIYPRLTPRMALVGIAGDPNSAGSEGTVSVQIVYDGVSYPSTPKTFQFKVGAINKQIYSSDISDIQYLLGAGTNNLLPNESTDVEMIFRNSNHTKRGGEAHTTISVKGDAHFVWRGKSTKEITTTLQPGFYCWKVKAKLVSENTAPDEGAPIFITSTVNYESRVYQRLLTISRIPTDEGEVANVANTLTPSTEAILSTSPSTNATPAISTFDILTNNDYLVAEDSNPVAVSTRVPGDNANPLVRLVKNLTAAKFDNIKYEYGGEYFDFQWLSERAFKPLPFALPQSAGQVMVALDKQTLMLAGEGYGGVLLYDIKRASLVKLANLSVRGEISCAIQRNTNGAPTAIYLFGSQTNESIQTINISDGSSETIVPEVVVDQNTATKIEQLNSSFKPSGWLEKFIASFGKVGSAILANVRLSRLKTEHSLSDPQKSFGKIEEVAHLSGNQYLLTTSSDQNLSFVYNLDTNIARPMTDWQLPVYTVINTRKSELRKTISSDLINTTDSELPSGHKTISLEDGTVLIYGGKFDHTLYPFQTTSAIYDQPSLAIKELKQLIEKADTLFAQLRPPVRIKYGDSNISSFTSELVREYDGVYSGTMKSNSGSGTELDDWEARHSRFNSDGGAYFNAFLVEPKVIVSENKSTSTRGIQPLSPASDIVAAGYREVLRTNIKPFNRTTSYKLNNHVYSLDISLDKTYISPILGSINNGKVQLLEDGKPINYVPNGLPNIISIRPGGSGETRKPPRSYHRDDYIYSSQYKPKTSTLPDGNTYVLETRWVLNKGMVNFSYVYNSPRTDGFKQFTAAMEVSLLAGAFQTDKAFYFEDVVGQKITIPDLNYIAKSNIYYDVQLSAADINEQGEYDDTFPLRSLKEGAKAIIKINITSRNQNGLANISPYQRVEVRAHVTNDMVYNHNHEKHAKITSGNFIVRDGGKINQNMMYQNYSMPENGSQIEIDLIDDGGTAYFAYNGSKGLSPYLIVDVVPTNYNLAIGGNGSGSNYSYRSLKNIQYPTKPQATDRFLYQNWLTDKEWEAFSDKVFTVKAMPIQ